MSISDCSAMQRLKAGPAFRAAARRLRLRPSHTDGGLVPARGLHDCGTGDHEGRPYSPCRISRERICSMRGNRFRSVPNSCTVPARAL